MFQVKVMICKMDGELLEEIVLRPIPKRHEYVSSDERLATTIKDTLERNFDYDEED